jgi:hypothetical protein
MEIKYAIMFPIGYTDSASVDALERGSGRETDDLIPEADLLCAFEPEELGLQPLPELANGSAPVLVS